MKSVTSQVTWPIHGQNSAQSSIRLRTSNTWQLPTAPSAQSRIRRRRGNIYWSHLFIPSMTSSMTSRHSSLIHLFTNFSTRWRHYRVFYPWKYATTMSILPRGRFSFISLPISLKDGATVARSILIHQFTNFSVRWCHRRAVEFTIFSIRWRHRRAVEFLLSSFYPLPYAITLSFLHVFK